MKVREPLAKDLEAEWSGPGRPLLLARGIRNSRTRAFMVNHGAGSLRPLYPELLELRRKTGWSDAQIAEQARRSYPARTRRLTRSHAVPEVSRVYLMDVDAAGGVSPEALLAGLRADPNVEYAEVNHVASAFGLPNDPFLGSSGSWGQAYQDLWGLQVIHAPAAWGTADGSGVVVAVIDTGVDYRHPDLAGNLWTNPGEIAGNGIDDDANGYIDDMQGLDFVGPDAAHPQVSSDPIDHNGHGTHVAGIIAATGNNGLGVIGVAWKARIMALKGLDDSGNGLDTTLAPAILYAAKNGADVINASWGGPGNSQTIEEAIQFASSVGVVFVAAAGNAGQDAWGYYPANSPEAITVAAVGPPTGAFCPSWSNYGTKIDVSAPGMDILSLRAAGSTLGPVEADAYMRLDGTSMAAPHVAGLAALLLSQRPGFPVESLRQTIRSSATPTFGSGYSGLVGAGVVDAQAALALNGALQAHLTSPTGRSRIAGPVQILGTAQGVGFDHYVLEYGAGAEPATWYLLQSSSQAVANGALGTFDPGLVPDGTYTLRLTAVDTLGRAFMDWVDIDVAYLAISSPAKPALPVTAQQFKPGFPLQITGKAAGPSFLSYRLEWAEGINPSSGWSTTGITLAGGGGTQVTDGILGTWDTTGIAKAGYYTIRLSADNTGFTSTATTLIHLEPDLLAPGWPKALDQCSLLYRGLVLVRSADGTRSLALVAPATLFNYTTQFFRFSPEGQVLNAMAVNGGGSNSGPSVGDVTGSGDEDVVFGAFQNMLTSFRRDNTYVMLQPRVGDQAVNYWSGDAPIVRLEGTGSLPSIVSMGSNTAAGVGSLYAWRGDGSMPYPRLASGIPDQNFLVTSNPTGAPRVLSGDVNGDGYQEFVVVEGASSSTYTLGLYTLDGARVPWAVPTFSGYPTSLALADLDHNGCLETVMVDSYRTLHVFQPDGSERPGWPRSLDPDWQEGAVAIGDLAHTGSEQIVVPAGFHLYVFNADGSAYSSAWPVASDGNLLGPVALADVDGDGSQEILVVQPTALQWLPGSLAQSAYSPKGPQPAGRPINRLRIEGESGGACAAWISMEAGVDAYSGTAYQEDHLVAYRLDGTVARSWNLLGAAGNRPGSEGVITVDDFDGDGRTDIGVTYPTIEGGGDSGWLIRGVATVLSTGAPFRAALNDWSTVNRDARNSAVLDRIHIPPPVPQLSGVSPSPAPPGATVTLTGTGLRFASSVTFNGLAAAFSVDSDTSIRANVPVGGASGTLAVRTPGGVGTFTFVEAPVGVTVSPKVATVLTGGQVTLSAEVTGTSDTGVIWSIESGGGTLSGSTGASVTYTAPVSPGTAKVTAASHADGTRTASTTIEIKSLDFNGDAIVDVLDLATMARAFGSTPADAHWNPAVDLNGDGTVDDNDLALFLQGL